MRIPRPVESKIVAKLYADAGALDWASLSQAERSEQYVKWLDDPEVGGRLREYLTEGQARVWIKDGPMKEWSRATSGIGRYAEYVDDKSDVPAHLVQKVLGPDWVFDRQNISVKPLRLVARRGEEETVLTWGNARDLKHLVWAALTASAEGDARPWVLCVVETFTRPTPRNERHAHLRIGERTSLAIKHVTL